MILLSLSLLSNPDPTFLLICTFSIYSSHESRYHQHRYLSDRYYHHGYQYESDSSRLDDDRDTCRLSSRCELSPVSHSTRILVLVHDLESDNRIYVDVVLAFSTSFAILLPCQTHASASVSHDLLVSVCTPSWISSHRLLLRSGIM
jgi:hypothetical protein